MEDYYDNLFKGANPKQFEFARELRQRQTQAELLLWEFLRNKKLNGLKFRRQHPIHRYIADFYCHEIKLIIEVDGGIHRTPENIAYDKLRDSDFLSIGIITLRFTNGMVLNKLSMVFKEINDFVKNK
jgi:very-short-patch-repair endonuclease